MDQYGDEFRAMFKYAVEIATDKDYLCDMVDDFIAKHQLSDDPDEAYDKFWELFNAAKQEYLD